MILVFAGCEANTESSPSDEGPARLTNSIGMVLIRIPAGHFMMGSPEPHPLACPSQPRHTVRISKAFYMGACEVTQQQYQQVMLGPNHIHFSPAGAGSREVAGLDTSRFPADGVSWGEAQAFCDALTDSPQEKAAGRRYRLPTEAEWEYACRAGTETCFAFGDELTLADANINADADAGTGRRPLLRTTAVGSYRPNALGLYDMHGNVWEWCQNGMRQFEDRVETDPIGPEAFRHAVRGGAWDFPAAYAQSDFRTDALREYVFVGFRVVCIFDSTRAVPPTREPADSDPSSSESPNIVDGRPAESSQVQFGSPLESAVPVTSSTAVERVHPLSAEPPRPGLRPVPGTMPSSESASIVELGRMLFFDPRLSQDGTVACASCHDPNKGWADGAALPTGIAGQRGRRHSPTLVNVAYLPHFFWDGRAAQLEDVAPQAIEDPKEMGMPMGALADRLNGIDGYRSAFESAFAGPATPEQIASAIAAFVRTIISGDAPFDRFRRGDLGALSPAARRGHDIFFFQANCGSCHLDLNLADGRFHNLGVGVEAAEPDPGRSEVTGDSYFDPHAFKTPTLREVVRTAPYMHDGRFRTLEEVLEFYLQGGIMNSHLDAKMNTIPMSDEDKADLIAFLKEGLTSETYPHVEPPLLPE